MPGDPAELARHLKPCGGVAVIGLPEGASAKPQADAWRGWLGGMELSDQSTQDVGARWAVLTRGELPGAADWSHQYGDAGNTASTEDQRVKGGLGVLWFGDPGPGQMVNRHDGAVGPLAVGGRLIVQGHESIMAYDAYNGVKLWEQANPGAYRTGVFQNYSPGNLVASEDAVFVMVRDKVHQFDAATGKLVRTHLVPEDKRGSHEWGYIAYQDGLLFGTATVREELEERQRRRGRRFNDATDTLFAIDVASGETAWTYNGKSISHHTVAVGPGHVYFIDSTLTAAQREELLREDKTELAKLTGEEAQRAEERMKRVDLRLAVALDARTGQKQWEQPVDVTDCSDVGTGGGKLTLMHQSGVLVLCGANANGHYWKQFLAGEFATRRLLCLSADDGHRLWAKDANYRHRPIVIGDEIIAEPWAYDLYTGTQKMRPHPLTGEPVPWSIIRPGHHCGMLTASTHMLMFRSGSTGFFDLDADAGTRHFAGHRLGCWINAIPANGLVMIPEASAGCVCQFSIASTIVLEPREARRPWTIASAVGAETPVARMALNLGAPGDRKDADGQLWLAYPRPNPRKETGLDLKLDIKPLFTPDGGYESVNAQTVQVAGTKTDWLYTSWANGLRKCTLPLLGKDDEPAIYTVRLHFAELDPNAKPGRRVFDVYLQGQVVLKHFDPAAAQGTAIVKRFDGIRVKDNLTVELVSGTDAVKSPLLNAIEVVRQKAETPR
jgi:outer membrane protein assembly factor BamB